MANIKLLTALKEIKDFGTANSGCGFSCAKMAEKAIAEYEANVDKPLLCDVRELLTCIDNLSVQADTDEIQNLRELSDKVRAHFA